MTLEKKSDNFGYQFNLKDSLCIVTGKGEIYYKQSTDAMKYVAGHPDFSPDCRIIVDLTEMNYHPSYDELLGMVDTLKLLRKNFKNKIGLVTDHKMSIVAKLVTIYCQLAGIEMKSFVCVNEAGSWVLAPDK